MNESLDTLNRALAGRYRIERELGAGGMATVYLAHDVRHDRRVALKVLRSELSAAIGIERFLAEIKTTANLQHPHILALFDSGEVDGTAFYVMPFIQGESLRERLKREKQLPIEDAVRIAREVADALGYAHGQGIIHRDIKPENILLQGGHALVADFGIALAASHSGRSARMTGTGIHLGTPQYMSPEQAMGDRELDARTDVYALGCVLYEMLVGEPPFTGPTAQVIVAKTLNAEPPSVATSRKSVPPNVVVAAAMALQKIPADRFETAAAFAAALANPAFTGSHGVVTPSGGWGGRRRTGTTWAVAVGLAVAGAAIGAWLTSMLRTPPEPSLPVTRFEIPLPESLTSRGFLSGGEAPVFPTRDGRLLWYETRGLFARPLDSLGEQLVLRSTRPLETSSIRDISPDGTELLVSTSVATAGAPTTGRGGRGDHVTLTTVPMRGGPARLVTDSADNAVWGDDGYIYYTFNWPSVRKSGLARVRVEGGPVDTLATLVDSVGVVPQNLTFLPGGRGLVVALGSRSAPRLAVFDLRARTWRPLGEGGPRVSYVEPGYLLYSSGPSIMAVPFDAGRLAFSGQAQPLVTVDAPSVRFTASGQVLAYRGYATGAAAQPLALRDRSGATRPLPNVPSGWTFTNPMASPDGKRFVVVGNVPFQFGTAGATAPIPNLFVYELPAGPMSRLPSADRETSPTWLPGGREIGFVRRTDDTTWTLMRRRWDGGEARPAYSNHTGIAMGSWLPDGRSVVVSYSNQPLPPSPTGAARGGGRGGPQGMLSPDIGLFALDRPDSLRPLVAGPASEQVPMVSPDGRFLAYQSNESGTTQVYVRSLSSSERRQVSLTSGASPRWGWSSRELFFTSGATFMSAEIRTAGGLAVGAVKPVFAGLTGAMVPVPLHGDSLFVAWGDGDTVTTQSPAPVVVLVNLRQALQRLFASRPPQ